MHLIQPPIFEHTFGISEISVTPLYTHEKISAFALPVFKKLVHMCLYVCVCLCVCNTISLIYFLILDAFLDVNKS